MGGVENAPLHAGKHDAAEPPSHDAANADVPCSEQRVDCGKRKERTSSVNVYCNASEYGGSSSATMIALDASGCKNLDDVSATVRRAFGLPAAKQVKVVAISGEIVALDTLHAPHGDLRLVLMIDGVLANFRMERVRSNLPVKGFLDDLASCQYTLLSALCELIDNSVQATRSNHEKREICIVMNTNHPDPSRRSVMVTDNGEGFDAAASEEFATLGMRGEISRAGDTLGEGISNAGTFKAFFSSILSRFGMGCKMAMNLIGDRYSLRSKTRGSLVVLEAAYDKFGDEYKYTERHIPCAPGDEDSSWSCIAVSGLQEGTTAACIASHKDDWPRVLAINLRSIYFCHLETKVDGKGGRGAGALKFAERMLRGLDKGVLAPPPGSSGGVGSRKRKSDGSGGGDIASAGSALRGGAMGHYLEKAADGLRKTLHAFKNPQLKRKSIAVSLSLQVNGVEYMHGNESAADTCKPGKYAQASEEGLLQGAEERARHGECLWQYVLSDIGQDCFPLWFEVEEEGRKSVVMGAILYYPIGEHSEEEMVPRREARVDLPRNSTESDMRFTTLWMGRWLPSEAFVPPFMTYDNHKLPRAPARAYRRAFGFMFVDRTFRPQQNKVAIEPNRSLWLSLRREMDNERIFAAYDSWLLECNKKYDHEVLFDTEPSHVVYDEERGMTRHKSIMLAGTRFKVGDKVKYARKGAKESAACYAEIKDFWQDGHPTQGRKDGTISVVELEALSLNGSSEPKEMRFSQISMSKVTPTKWKEESIRLSKNVVVDIAWENDMLEGGAAVLEAGTVLRNEAVVCLNSDGIPICPFTKSSASGCSNAVLGFDVVLVVTTPGLTSHEYLSVLRDADARKDGSKRFEFGALIDGDETIFSTAGRYKLEFNLRKAKLKGTAPNEVVKSQNYIIEVVPGIPKALELLNREVEIEDCPVDTLLPRLSFQLLDAFRNTVQSGFGVASAELFLTPPSSRAKIEVDATRFRCSMSGSVINVTDMCIGTACDRAALGKWRLIFRTSISSDAPSPGQKQTSPHIYPHESVSQVGAPSLPSPPKAQGKRRAVQEEAKKVPKVQGVITMEAIVTLLVIHGKPASLTLMSPTPAKIEQSASKPRGGQEGELNDTSPAVAGTLVLNNMSELPKLEYTVQDCAGNTCTTFEGWLVILSPALQNKMHVRVASGIATFSQQNALKLCSPVFKKLEPALPRAWNTQEADAFLAQSGAGACKRRKGGRGKKGENQNNKGPGYVAIETFRGFFIGDSDFIVEGDFVLLNEGPAQVIALKQQRNSHEVVLRCMQSVGGGCGGAEVHSRVGLAKGLGAVGFEGDGHSMVRSFAGSKRSVVPPRKREVVVCDDPDRTVNLDRASFITRSYVFVQAFDAQPLDARFLHSSVFLCRSPISPGICVGLPLVALDAFVVDGTEEPSQDMSELSRRMCVHSRTNLQLQNSTIPRSLDIVISSDANAGVSNHRGEPRKVVDKVEKHEVAIKSLVAFGITGKPGHFIEGLLLEIRDEAGWLCRDDIGAQASAASEASGEGNQEDTDRWEVSCSWTAEPITVLKYEEDRVVLPKLRVPTDMPELECTVWLKISDESIIEATFKVWVETGPPAQLRLSLDGAEHASLCDTSPQVQVGCDCAFRLSVLDERGALIEGDCDIRQNTSIGAMQLRKLQIMVSDASGKENPILVRQENFEKSTQFYTEDVRPQAELDDEGNFWVRCIRLQGQAGPITLRVEAQVEVEQQDTGDEGGQTVKFAVKGEKMLELCVGKPAAMVLQGYKFKRRGTRGAGEGASQRSMLSQALEVLIRCQRFVPLDPLVVDVVDECRNLIPDWKGKVILDFKGSGIQRCAVVSSRKADGLSPEQVLHFEKGEDGKMILLGLALNEAGSFVAACRSLGLPDIPVHFEVAAGNVVKSVDLQIDSDVDLLCLPLGSRVHGTIYFHTEDGAMLASLDKTSMIFVIESCHELDVCSWKFTGGCLQVELQLPTYTCASEVYAIYSEKREDFTPKPADVESNRISVQVLAGPVDHISLQTKRGQDSLVAASERELVLPPMLIAALDEHDNKSTSLPGGAPLRCEIVPEIECPNDDLELCVAAAEGGEVQSKLRSVLTADVNPFNFNYLVIKRRDGEAMDFVEFDITFRVEPSSLGIEPLRHTFTHSNNRSISQKIKNLREREILLREQIDEAKRQAQHAEQRMQERIKQGLSDSEDERNSERIRLSDKVQVSKRILMEGERDMAAEPSRHNVNVDGLQGVVGVVADLGVIDRVEGCDSRDIRKCLTWAFSSKMKSVLFQSQADVDEFDKLPKEDTLKRRRIKSMYAAEMLQDSSKARKKYTLFEGWIGYAADLVVVNDFLDPDHSQAARKCLNVIMSNLVVFAKFSQAVSFQKAMVLQKIRIPRLVGLDRPFDIIDADGGRTNVSHTDIDGLIDSLPAMGILAFGSSSLGKSVRNAGEAAATQLREFDKMSTEHCRDSEVLEQNSATHETATVELEQVLNELETLAEYARPAGKKSVAARGSEGGVGGVGSGRGAGREKGRRSSNRGKQ